MINSIPVLITASYVDACDFYCVQHKHISKLSKFGNLRKIRPLWLTEGLALLNTAFSLKTKLSFFIIPEVRRSHSWHRLCFSGMSFRWGHTFLSLSNQLNWHFFPTVMVTRKLKVTGGETCSGYLELYDFTNCNWHDLNKKKQTWMQISKALEIFGHLFLSIVATIKNTLQCSFFCVNQQQQQKKSVWSASVWSAPKVF